MISRTIRTEKLVLTPTSPTERAAFLAAVVVEACAEMTIKVEPNSRCTSKETRVLRFENSQQIAAMEDALRTMRVRMEEAERAALTR